MSITKLTAGCILLISCLHTNAQTDGVTTNAGANPQSIAQVYYQSRGESLPVYNGRQFFDQYAAIEGSAFFPVDSWQKGSVTYDGTVYPGISLKYDIYRDELLVQPPNEIAIVLFSDRVKEFTINGNRFVRLAADRKSGMKNGFYHVIVEGRLTVYARREMVLEENIVDLRVDRKFRSRKRYYALSEGKYRSISRQNHLMELLGDKRNDVQQEIRAKDIYFKNNEEAAMIFIGNYFNQLKP